MKHILVIDDVSTNLKCLGMILRNQYQVTMLKSGEDAVKYLASHTPDMILLDIRMHGMDGYEVMEYLKKNPSTAHIPVILITADAVKENKEKGIALGAADFIGKPFEPQYLLDRIEAVLKTKE